MLLALQSETELTPQRKYTFDELLAACHRQRTRSLRVALEARIVERLAKVLNSSLKYENFTPHADAATFETRFERTWRDAFRE